MYRAGRQILAHMRGHQHELVGARRNEPRDRAECLPGHRVLATVADNTFAFAAAKGDDQRKAGRQRHGRALAPLSVNQIVALTPKFLRTRYHARR